MKKQVYGVYDALFHNHNEPVNQWYTTNGAIIFCGNLAVEEAHSLGYDAMSNSGILLGNISSYGRSISSDFSRCSTGD